jgi:hypothetical protein
MDTQKNRKYISRKPRVHRLLFPSLNSLASVLVNIMQVKTRKSAKKFKKLKATFSGLKKI